MKTTFILCIFVLSLVVTGCAKAQSPQGFRLPSGDPAAGKKAFTELQCHTCHTVAGEPGLPPPSQTIQAPVILGGASTKAKRYEELVTAIIHPSHNLSEQLQKEWMEDAKLSPMGSFNHLMTVQQMIDLVAFLQPHYGQDRERIDSE